MATVAKQAMPKMVRGEDGRQKLVYVDVETGDVVPNGQLDKYEIITGGGTDYYDPTPDGTDTDDDENDLNPGAAPSNTQSDDRGGGGDKQRQDAAGYAYGKNVNAAAKSYKTAAQNYINKPEWTKFASMIPGPVGLAAKAANTAVNMNNVSATNQARASMGLEPLGVKETIKGAIKDQKGQIATVDINGVTHQVGFETLDKYGRTNMTPEEATKRAAAVGTTVKEVPDTNKPAKSGGILSKAVDVFSGKPKETGGIGQTGTPNTNPQATARSPNRTPGPDMAYDTKNVAKETLASAGAPAGIADPGKPAGRPSANYSANYGPLRPDAPAKSIVDAVNRSVQNTFGPGYSAVGISGTPDDKNKNGQIDPHEHPKGTSVRHDLSVNTGGQVGALDFDVVETATGKKVTDEGMMHELAKDFAYNNPETAGVGFGKGYMAPGRMHLDNTGIGGVWSKKGQPVNPELAASVAFGKNNPVNPNFAYEAPTPRPGTLEAIPRELVEAVFDAPLGFSGGSVLAGQYTSPTTAFDPKAQAAGTPTAGYDPRAQAAGTPTAGYNPSYDTPVERNAANRPAPGISQTGQTAMGTPVGMGRPEVPGGISPTDKVSLSPEESANMQNNKFGMIAGLGRVNPAVSPFRDPGIRASTPVGMGRPSAQGSNLSMSPNAPNKTKDDFGPTLDPTKHESVFSGMQPGQSVARGVVTSSVAPGQGKFDKVDLSNASPAEMASLGITARSVEERNQMARAIAGELSPASLAGIKAGNPEAMRELANIATSIENRAASAKYGNLNAALSPSQYNSLKPENLDVTNANMGIYGGPINSALDAFYSGTIKPDNYGITSYHNPAISNPGWSNKMEDSVVTGEHKFGVLDGPYDYGISPDFAAMREAYSNAQISDTRGFNPYDAGMLSPGSNRPASGGAGFSPGGMNSPSGSSRSDPRGGSGMGTGGPGGMSGGAGFSPGGMNSPSGSSADRSSKGGMGTGSSPGGSAGQSGGGGFSPGGMNSPSGSSSGGKSSPSGSTSNNGSNSPGGFGSPGGKSSSSTSGGKSAGATSRSEGWT